MKFDLCVAQCQKEVYKLGNEKREVEAPLLLLLYTPKILYNSRSRKTAQLGTTKIPATDKNDTVVSPLSLPPK